MGLEFGIIGLFWGLIFFKFGGNILYLIVLYGEYYLRFFLGINKKKVIS